MVKVTGNITFDVDALEAGNIVAQVLKDDYRFITKDINELRAIETPSDVDLQDLENDIKVQKAMIELLSYYMTFEDFANFMHSTKKDTDNG